ncbi:MAG: MarR family winged helix-turn-helix transcriptional regulator [Polyangiaceae bacterium]
MVSRHEKKKEPRRRRTKADAKPSASERAAELEAAKRASTAQLLFRCARRVNERSLAIASERFGVTLRPSHAALLPHIALEGTRQTELARRLGISKQGTNQLVDELESFGMLERAEDPSDGRAKLVRFTAAGERSLFEGLALLSELERKMRDGIGEGRMDALHDALLHLEEWLDSQE